MLVHTSGRQSRPSKSTDLLIDIMRVGAYLTVHLADHRDGLLTEVTRLVQTLLSLNQAMETESCDWNRPYSSQIRPVIMLKNISVWTLSSLLFIA
jgi:hypothetical protein